MTRLEYLRDKTCEDCSYINTLYCTDCSFKRTFEEYIRIDKALEKIFEINASRVMPQIPDDVKERINSNYSMGYFDGINFVQNIIRQAKDGNI